MEDAKDTGAQAGARAGVLTSRGWETELDSKVQGCESSHKRSRRGCFVALRFGGRKNRGHRDTGAPAGAQAGAFLITVSYGGRFEERID